MEKTLFSSGLQHIILSGHDGAMLANHSAGFALCSPLAVMTIEIGNLDILTQSWVFFISGLSQ